MTPYDYLRVEPHRDFDVVIFGGEDHKTGQQDDTVACYRRLEERLTAIIPQVELTHRWSGQVIETPDGLPYIGQSADHQYAATGYAGNGLTFGTLAGIMISDAILGRSNPWAELFDPGRKALTRGLWDYLKENVDYPYYMIRDRFAGAEAQSLRAVKRGQGKIIERNGAKVAAYRDQAGHGDAPLGDLHAYGMRRGLEHRRTDVGLPVSRVAIQADRRRDLRTGRSAAVEGGVTRTMASTMQCGGSNICGRQRRRRRISARSGVRAVVAAEDVRLQAGRGGDPRTRRAADRSGRP